MTQKIMRMLTAEEQSVALLNLAVPSPIFSETEPIFVRFASEALDLDE